MDHTKLSIVYLNFNRLAETQTTTLQLSQLCKHYPNIEIIAVDNGSSDGTAEFLSGQSAITAILLADNLGIAGYKAGFNQAAGDYILVLDDDSCPVDMTKIEQAMKRMDQNLALGITACHIQGLDGKPQWSWHLPQQQVLATSPFFIGCGFIIKRALFKAIGWYPDDFFLYQNEIDVSFKVRLQGYDIIYDPECVIIHRGTPNQRPGWRRVFFPTRNTLWLIRCYYPQPQASYMLLSRVLIGLYSASLFGQLGCYAKAVREGLLKPIDKTLLPADLHNIFLPFYKQNSILHQLFKRT
ncbi:MAG: glycosyltransferase [Methylococcaceae bacterium]|nr:glycosyltransferase [Methylococcaceae bacterium]